MSKSENESTINSIRRTLEDIKSLILLLNRDKLQEIRNGLLKEGTIKTQIYELCDGSKTSLDIASIINKSPQYTGSYISMLRREGLIQTVEKEGKQVHEQVF